MNKFSLMILALLIITVSANAVMWDFGDILTGKQLIPDLQIWFNDSQGLTFGSDEDGTLYYDPVKSAARLDDIAFIPAAGLKLGGRSLADDYNCTTTANDLDVLVNMDARSANRTYVLKTAAAAAWQYVTVRANYAPGSYFVRVNVTGEGLIDGKKYVVTTDDSSTFFPSITLYSNGASWTVINAYGTWTKTDK